MKRPLRMPERSNVHEYKCQNQRCGFKTSRLLAIPVGVPSRKCPRCASKKDIQLIPYRVTLLRTDYCKISYGEYNMDLYQMKEGE